MSVTLSRITYDDQIVRRFTHASILWGVVGMLVGVIIALQLAFWQANLPPFLTFGRLRPLHTNAVIFAFVGNMIFAGIYYSTQRLLKARMASDLLSNIHFWGWQAIIVAAAVTLPLGFTQAKEYAELEWPIDIAIALIWVVFAINFFWTLYKRNEKQLYVALWFYIATIVTIAVLHIVNSLSMPVAALKSYALFGGVQDALVQWWYGHNAVAFFLTTPVLGIMYYFIPKAADRPVFSYRLSIIHFWSLVFLYIWAGPHHLLYTALPDWAQTLGMLFSVMLWAPSWGGMINGLLTLRGAWDRVRKQPELKFFVAAVTFYGMATFEGPLLSIKGVSGLAHYTDWIIGHVHSGSLGWNGFMAAGMFYWLMPRLYKTELHSLRLANAHFYTSTFGLLLYVIAMWVAGITQGLMWRAQNDAGGLMYPNFVETFLAIRPMYWMRLIGGSLYLVGYILMVYNLWQTARSGKPANAEVEVAVKTLPTENQRSGLELLVGSPVLLSLIVIALFVGVGFVDSMAGMMLIALGVGMTIVGVVALLLAKDSSAPSWHSVIEGRGLIFTVLVVVAVLVGGIVELIPSLVIHTEAIQKTATRPYSALELEGRDVYIQEGCYVCHSQMIRPFTWESARYGAVSQADDSIFDHPFQWGSRRIGPDLARVGGKYSNLWHYEHMLDPRKISPGSNMPPYTHLKESRVMLDSVAEKLRAMRAIGVPYTPEQIQTATVQARAQAQSIVDNLKKEAGADLQVDSKLVALISYLQRLGHPSELKNFSKSLESTNTSAALAKGQ